MLRPTVSVVKIRGLVSFPTPLVHACGTVESLSKICMVFGVFLNFNTGTRGFGLSFRAGEDADELGEVSVLYPPT